MRLRHIRNLVSGDSLAGQKRKHRASEDGPVLSGGGKGSLAICREAGNRTVTGQPKLHRSALGLWRPGVVLEQ